MAKIKGLRGCIYERFESESEFARLIGWPKQRLSKITNGTKEPTVSEINQIATGLGISVGDVAAFFLGESSPNERLNVSSNKLGQT